MTAVRARGSQRIRCNSERGKDRLEGLQPVVEDWHAKVCLLEVHVHVYVYQQWCIHCNVHMHVDHHNSVL